MTSPASSSSCELASVGYNPTITYELPPCAESALRETLSALQRSRRALQRQCMSDNCHCDSKNEVVGINGVVPARVSCKVKLNSTSTVNINHLSNVMLKINTKILQFKIKALQQINYVSTNATKQPRI